MAIKIGDALLKLGVDKADFQTGIQQVTQQAKDLQKTFRDLERVTRPIGSAMTLVGGAGVLLSEKAKDWNNALGDTLVKMRPLFVAMTTFGGILLTLPPIIRGVKAALDLLKVGLSTTMSLVSGFGLGIGIVGALIYSLTQWFPAMTADIKRWSEALAGAKDQLEDLEKNGKGASTEANILRTAINDLTISLSKFSKVGDDNVVTVDNIDAAIGKLAESVKKLNQIDGELSEGFQAAIDSGSRFSRMLERMIGITVGDTATDVIELTNNIIALREAQEEEAETARKDAVDALEQQYGLRASATKSLVDQLEDEIDARRDALDSQLEATRDASDDMIKAYRKEHDEKIRLLNQETEATVKALQDQLDALNNQDKAAERSREDQEDADTEARLRQAIKDEWTRAGKARATEELNKFLEEKAAKLADRQREDARESLQKQIRDTQDAASKKQAEYQKELDDKIQIENDKLDAAETAIDAELLVLENSLTTRRNILQRELDDAVEVQNRIRDNAINAINAVLAAQINAANQGWTANLTPQQWIETQSGIDYENAMSAAYATYGYAKGGVISEPTLLYGLRSKRVGIAGEAGPEVVSPVGSGGGDINISGTFYIREEADIPKVAAELLRQRDLKNNMGKRRR